MKLQSVRISRPRSFNLICQQTPHQALGGLFTRDYRTGHLARAQTKVKRQLQRQRCSEVCVVPVNPCSPIMACSSAISPRAGPDRLPVGV